MQRKVLDEIDDMFKAKPTREIINDADVVAAVEKRKLKEYFNLVIETYLRQEKKSISSF